MPRKGPKHLRKNLERIRKNLGLRGVAIALYRIITSKNPVLVVEMEATKEPLGTLLEGVTNGIYSKIVEETNTPPFETVKKATYKENFKEYSGREICFINKEKTVKNPGVEIVETLLKNAVNLAVNPIKNLHETLERTLNTVEEVRRFIQEQEEKGGSYTMDELKEIIQNLTETSVEKKIVKHTLILWGKKHGKDIAFEESDSKISFL